MSVIDLLLFGLIIGLLLSILDRRKKGGVTGPILLGITGSIIGLSITSVLSTFSVGLSPFVVLVFSVSSTFFLFSLSRTFKHEN